VAGPAQDCLLAEMYTALPAGQASSYGAGSFLSAHSLSNPRLTAALPHHRRHSLHIPLLSRRNLQQLLRAAVQAAQDAAPVAQVLLRGGGGGQTCECVCMAV
jgi:hypothetical protein